MTVDPNEIFELIIKADEKLKYSTDAILRCSPSGRLSISRTPPQSKKAILVGAGMGAAAILGASP